NPTSESAVTLNGSRRTVSSVLGVAGAAGAGCAIAPGIRPSTAVAVTTTRGSGLMGFVWGFGRGSRGVADGSGHRAPRGQRQLPPATIGRRVTLASQGRTMTVMSGEKFVRTRESD